jgi:hypothetical protein
VSLVPPKRVIQGAAPKAPGFCSKIPSVQLLFLRGFGGNE